MKQENKVGEKTPKVAKRSFATFGAQLLIVFFFIFFTYVAGVASVYAADLTISGTLYGDDRATPITTTKPIKVAVATSSVSVHSTSTDNGAGTWSIIIPDGHSISSGTPITVFIDGDTIMAVTVTKASSTANIANLNIYQNNVTLKNEAAGTTTKASDLYHYDSTDDADIPFTASSTLGRLTVASGQTLYVATSTTFHIDLPTVADNFEIATSATALASSTLALSGDYYNAGAYKTAAASAAAWTSRTPAADNGWNSVTYGNGLFVAVANSGTGNRVMTSPDGITWTSRTSAADNSWSSVTYGNGLFVAVSVSGTGNRVMTSPDGITWTSRTSAADNNWNSVTYGNGLFVSVGFDGSLDQGAVMTSPDGITWTSRTAAANNTWTSVTYGNGLFVAVSDSSLGTINDRVMTSPDGITWTSRTAAADNSLNSVTYGNGLFVAVGSVDQMTSPDGITWTAGVGAGSSMNSVTYGNGLFVAVGNFYGSKSISTSADGVTWTDHSPSNFNLTNDAWYGVTYGNGLFVAVGYNSGLSQGLAMTSSELPTLSLSGASAQILSGNMTGADAIPNIITAGAGTKTFTANASTSDFVIASTSGAVTTGSNMSINGNLTNASTFVASSSLYLTGNYVNSGTTTASTNLYFTGTNQIATGTWNGAPNLSLSGTGIKTLYTNVSTTDLTVSSGSTFLSPAALTIVDDYINNGTSSYAAAIWTTRTAVTDNEWNSVTYGEGLFVAVASYATGNGVMTSPDGITWTSRTSAADNDWESVTYGNGLFVAVSSSGTGNRVMTSPDGITWTSRTSAADNVWWSVTYGNGLFVAVANSGTGNRVMTSPDGITWTSRTSAADNEWYSVTYGNGLFVAVARSGTGNRVMTSSDGITWTSRTSAADNMWYSVTYGNGLFVAVAYGDEVGDPTDTNVMTSPDGITWTLRTGGAHNLWYSVTYGNGLFVAVGEYGTTVMTSLDGISWNRKDISNGYYWTSVTYGNGLFVVVSPFDTDHVMTSPVSTITFDGASAQSISGSLSSASAFGNVVFSGAGEKTFSNNASTSDFTISATNTSVVAPSALTVRGSYTNNGTFNANTGHVYLHTESGEVKDLAGNLNTNNVSTSAFHDLTLSGEGSVRPLAPLAAADDFTTTASSTFLASSTLAVGGDFTLNGIYRTAGTAASSTEWISRTPAVDNEWTSVTYGNGLFVAVAQTGTGNRVMTSPDGITWTSRTSAADNSWSSITYANGLFVAVSQSGTGNRVMTSPDGITWTSRTPAVDNGWTSIAYANGLFVAVSNTGTGNRVMTSPDGITWTSRTSAADNNWLSVTYGNGLFVAVSGSGTGNRVMTSPDGITWTSRTSAADNTWRDVTFDNGLFVAVSSSGTGNRVMTSPDGITWTSRTSAADNNWLSVTYGSGLFVAVAQTGTGNRVMTSVGGETPITFNGTTAQILSGSMVATNTLPSLIFNASGSKTFSDNASTTNLTIASTSGTVTATAQLTLTGDLQNNSTFVASTNLYLAGVNNQTATGTFMGTSALNNLILSGRGQKIFTTTASTTDLITENGVEFVAPPMLSVAGSYTNNGTSTYSATHWTIRTPAVDNSWRAVTYGNGLFVAVSTTGFSNRVMTSPDGITWTSRTSAADNNWRSVTYGNGLFVAVSSSGTGNRVMTSPDGITWTSRTSAANDSWYSVTYGNGLFVAVACGINSTSCNSTTGNRVMTSTDGITWTSRTSASDNQWYSVTYGNGLFVAVSISGTGNRVMTSPDGIIWTSRTSAADNQWASVAYGNGLFVAVGATGTGDRVMTSPDGITWTSRTSAADNQWLSVVYGNGLFVAVSQTGAGNHIMTSPDGITWTSRIPAVDSTWSSVSYGNGLFVSVSYSGTGNRVMTSGISTVNFKGASAQSISGSLTGASAFGNVVISGAGEKTFNDIASTTNLTINTTATTTFTDTLDVRETFSANAGAKLALAAGATTTIGTLELLGTNDAPVSLRSTIDDTQWYLDITGDQLTVEYVNVKDSNASSSQTGEVIAINSIDSNNNSNWIFSDVVGSSTIADHDNTQVNNAFNFQNKTNEALFAFKLTPENGTATVTDLTITLSGSRKINAVDFSNLRFFRDFDSDAAYDVTDEQIGGSGVMTISGQQGTIVFSGDFLATTSQNYVLIGDWNAPENGSFLTLELLPGGVISTDRYGSQEIFGSVSRIQHNRNNKGGGGGTRAAIGGEDIPSGRTVETGGTEDGGGAIDSGTGEEIGNDPSFRWPTAHSGDWQSIANAYDHTNSTYATTSAANTSSFLNHGFSVPTTNQITGIEVKLELSGTTAAGDVGVQLSWDGGSSWTSAKTTVTLTTSDRVVSLGGPSDDWGRGWSAANFSNTNFTVRLTGNPSGNTIQVDAIQVRVYHQATGGGAGGGGAI